MPIISDIYNTYYMRGEKRDGKRKVNIFFRTWNFYELFSPQNRN